jgi:hypothetical protein
MLKPEPLPTDDRNNCKHINIIIIIKTAAGVARVFCRVYVDDNGSRGYQSYYYGRYATTRRLHYVNSICEIFSIFNYDPACSL